MFRQVQPTTTLVCVSYSSSFVESLMERRHLYGTKTQGTRLTDSRLREQRQATFQMDGTKPERTEDVAVNNMCVWSKSERHREPRCT
jgi:hypothetical protein